MFVRLVAEKHNVLFECDRVIETETSLSFCKGDDVFIELIYTDEEKLRIYAMNNDGKTIDNWGISPEGKTYEK